MVSVIVPIYNAEQYLSVCLESILKQTYKDLEVILVEDGSTDGSLQICMKYAERDARISILQEGHHGLVAARKLGVEKAEGTYCMFVDSDDWIEEKLLESIIPLTENGTADIVSFNVKSVEADRIRKWEYTIAEGRYEDEQLEQIYEKMMFDFEKGCPGVIQSIWTKLMKRELLWSSIKSVDERITLGEDAAVVYHAFLLAKKIIITNQYLYYYRIHQDSMVRSKNMNVFEKIYIFQQYMRSLFLKFENKYGLEKQLQAYLIHFIVKGISDNFSLKMRKSYHIPLGLLEKEKKIILYGAGVVGKSYYRQLMAYEDIQVVAWVDGGMGNQSFYDCIIESPEVMDFIDYDKVLIAVKDQKIAGEIKKRLCKKIPEERVLWAEPKDYWWEKEITL